MSEVDWLEVILVVGVLFLIIRNIRKDKSDGRDIGGGGGPPKPPVHRK